MANQISTPYRYCHLYHIQDGDTSYHLTDFDVDVTSPEVEGGAPAASWESYAVTHGEVRHELTLDNFDFAVYLSAVHPIADYITIPLVNTIYITVYEALVNGRAVTGSRTIYRGWCVGVAAQVDSGQVQVMLKPVNLGQSEGFPKHSITARCRWMFGSPECGMALSDIEVEAEVVRAWPYTMLAEISYASSFEDRFSGGILKINGVNVNILRSSATEGDPAKTILSLAHSPVDENGDFIIQPGVIVTARFGCRKTRGACVYHGNIANFGGFPFVPLANPALGGLPLVIMISCLTTHRLPTHPILGLLACLVTRTPDRGEGITGSYRLRLVAFYGIVVAGTRTRFSPRISRIQTVKTCSPCIKTEATIAFIFTRSMMTTIQSVAEGHFGLASRTGLCFTKAPISI